MIRVWTDPHNDSVLISLCNDGNPTHLIHIPGITDAISQIEVVLETLRNSRPLEDIDVTQMVEDVNHEFSRLSGGEALWALLLTLPITREGTWPERWYELTAGIYYTNVLGLFL